MDLVTVAEELYALTPEAFTKARNERAKQAKPEDSSMAVAIGKLPKPSTAAWAVNMLTRHRAEELTQVLDLGLALRKAQDSLDGAELRELTKQRRQLTSAVTSQARSMAGELGVRVSDSVATQVEETLRAAMTDELAARAVRTGQLVGALTSTGLGDVDVSTAVAVPEALGMSARPVAKRMPQLSVVPDARDRVEALEATAEAAEKKLVKARKRVAKLEARNLQVQGELEEVRRRASELEHALENVDDELTTAERKQERAERRYAAAHSDLESTREQLGDR
ncbi:MAG: hypothetical protein M3393_07955 [Actinomycetota bacterium]|nr:hypothetical protein [Actinomycetota bacterium]